jgi:PAS domain S-box-containing protein
MDVELGRGRSFSMLERVDASTVAIPEAANILLVDDRTENLVALEVILEPLVVNLVRARSGQEALRHLLTNEFALILLDVQMPVMDGFETAAVLKQRERSRNIPIIFVTAIDKEDRYITRGYSAGAVDYITKPFDPDILRSKVGVFIDLFKKEQQLKRQSDLLHENELREISRRQMDRERELERVHMEEIARSEASLNQFKKTLDAVMDSVLIFDPKTLNHFYANAGALALLGYTLDELLSMGFTDCMVEDDAKRFKRMVAAAEMGPPTVRRFEATFRRKNGGIVPAEVLLQYISEPGEPGRFVSVIRDITERRRSQAELARAYEHEKRIATVLQTSLLLTPTLSALPGLTVEAFYEPALDDCLVGGDFYDAFNLPDGEMALVVGDVSGKGLLAAARIAEVKYALRAILYELNDPAKAVKRLNRMLMQSSFKADCDAGAFIALSLIVTNPATGKAVASLSGAEPSLVVNSRAQVRRISPDGLPLGVDPDADYEAQAFQVYEDDTIFMFTDGIVEARNGPNFFGEDGVERILRQTASLPHAHDIGVGLFDAAKMFAGGKLKDDACLVIARRSMDDLPNAAPMQGMARGRSKRI